MTFNVSLKSGVDPRGVVLDPDNPRVEMTFASAQWVCFSPAASDTNSIDLGMYDLSKIPLGGVDPDHYLTEFADMWRRDQRCPNRDAFEVQHSEWVMRTGAQRYGCRHYIVAGHDAAVEVLAKGFSWKYVGRREDDNPD